MSHIKRIHIVGELPFDCANDNECCGILGTLNGPCLGWRIEWGKSHYVPNEHGGRTTMYAFVLHGEDAFRYEYAKQIVECFRRLGTVSEAKIMDMDFDPDNLAWEKL